MLFNIHKNWWLRLVFFCSFVFHRFVQFFLRHVKYLIKVAINVAQYQNSSSKKKIDWRNHAIAIEGDDKRKTDEWHRQKNKAMSFINFSYSKEQNKKKSRNKKKEFQWHFRKLCKSIFFVIFLLFYNEKVWTRFVHWKSQSIYSMGWIEEGFDVKPLCQTHNDTHKFLWKIDFWWYIPILWYI